MALRITESRIPEGCSPYALGQADVSSCEKYSLISNLTSPLHVNANSHEYIDNCIEYYVFIDEPSKEEFRNYSFLWEVILIDLDGNSHEIIKNDTPSEVGFVYIPISEINKRGKLIVSVTVYHIISSVAELMLEQNVLELDKTLENLYSNLNINRKRNIGALAGNIETSREIVNDLINYIIIAAPPKSIENSNDDVSITMCSKNIPAKFLTAIIYELIYAYTSNTKKFRLSASESVVNFLEQGSFDKYLLDDTYLIPLGVCGLTPQFVTTALKIYPDLLLNNDNGNIQRCDLFNLLRFPKTNIQLCSAILSNIKKNSQYNNLNQEQLFDKKDALIYICEEFFKGLLSSLSESQNKVESNDKIKALATKAVDMLSYPFISSLSCEPILGFETYKVLVLDCRSGQPVADARVKEIKIGSIDAIFDIDSKALSGNSLTNFQEALKVFKQVYKDNSGTKKIRNKYNSKNPWTAYNAYWTDRGCPYLCQNIKKGENPVVSSYAPIIEEYNSHRVTDSQGYLNIKIPRVLLLTQEKITIEVGFHDFPVVLEKQNSDSRTNPIMRSNNVLAKTYFVVSWEGNQSTEWGDSFGWKVRNDLSNCESLFRVSEKFDVSMHMSEDTEASFNNDYTNIYYDTQNNTQNEICIHNPHAVLFAMQWCQPVWDNIDDAEGNTRVNETSFVARKYDQNNWIKDLNMHIVSMHVGGDRNPFGHYYGFYDMEEPTHRKTETNPKGYHQGIDLYSGSEGNILCFATHGGWINNYFSTSYGRNIRLRLKAPNSGPYFRYAHLNNDNNTFTTKEHVLCGEIIAQAGRTGNIAGVNEYPSHMHMELWNASEVELEPNDIASIDSKLIDSSNIKILPSNKLPLILPCKCKYGNNRPISNCIFSEIGILKTCWAVQEFPYDKNTIDHSCNNSNDLNTNANNTNENYNKDQQSEALIDDDGMVQFICPYIFKEGADKIAQLQAQLNFIYYNKGKSPNIPNSDFEACGKIDGDIGSNADSKTKVAIKGLIMAYMESKNNPTPNASDGDVSEFIDLCKNGTEPSNETVKKAYEWLKQMVPIT